MSLNDSGNDDSGNANDLSDLGGVSARGRGTPLA